ncbi:hypothetical protein LNKW23_38890 [Paralimibaculum aggregatum]|uniref:Uncharacterized protein n=1 Tax=Paralimibaculum aggregatum TaxID=3036245 RepID=A0ABQ6LRH5_9RHOB|nr:hypothetical protein LNKW23_38890 [Limibaculum sp. NKW23]
MIPANATPPPRNRPDLPHEAARPMRVGGRGIGRAAAARQASSPATMRDRGRAAPLLAKPA